MKFGWTIPLAALGVACGACVIALVTGAIMFSMTRTRERLPPPREVVESRPSPTIHCLFSDFTHASVVAGFDFAVALPKGGPPRFAERGEAVRNDPSINFEADSRPAWSYAVDQDGTDAITSPDGATRILLYGLKRGDDDALWIEAGIRSNTIRNFDGKCLQSHFIDSSFEAPTPRSAR